MPRFAYRARDRAGNGPPGRGGGVRAAKTPCACWSAAACKSPASRRKPIQTKARRPRARPRRGPPAARPAGSRRPSNFRSPGLRPDAAPGRAAVVPRSLARSHHERAVRRRGRAAAVGADQGSAAANPQHGAVGKDQRGRSTLPGARGVSAGLRSGDRQPDPGGRGDRLPQRHDRPHHRAFDRAARTCAASSDGARLPGLHGPRRDRGDHLFHGLSAAATADAAGLPRRHDARLDPDPAGCRPLRPHLRDLRGHRRGAWGSSPSGVGAPPRSAG